MNTFGIWFLLIFAFAQSGLVSAKVIFYGFDMSRPSAVAQTVAKVINLDYEYRVVDVTKGEQLQDSFVKMNPQHTVPTIDDDGKIVWESTVIATYLVDKYAKDDSLYPKDLYLRSKCLQRMIFVNTFVSQPFANMIGIVIFQGGKEIPQFEISQFVKAYNFLEAFLANDPYLVGDHFTIPDISAVIMIAQSHEFVPITEKEYPKLKAWYDRARKNIPFVDQMIGDYPKIFHQIITSVVEKNKGK